MPAFPAAGRAVARAKVRRPKHAGWPRWKKHGVPAQSRLCSPSAQQVCPASIRSPASRSGSLSPRHWQPWSPASRPGKCSVRKTSAQPQNAHGSRCEDGEWQGKPTNIPSGLLVSNKVVSPSDMSRSSCPIDFQAATSSCGRTCNCWVLNLSASPTAADNPITVRQSQQESPTDSSGAPAGICTADPPCASRKCRSLLQSFGCTPARLRGACLSSAGMKSRDLHATTGLRCLGASAMHHARRKALS